VSAGAGPYVVRHKRSANVPRLGIYSDIVLSERAVADLDGARQEAYNAVNAVTPNNLATAAEWSRLGEWAWALGPEGGTVSLSDGSEIEVTAYTEDGFRIHCAGQGLEDCYVRRINDLIEEFNEKHGGAAEGGRGVGGDCATCGGTGAVCCGQYLDTGECCSALYGTDRLQPCPDCPAEGGHR
jgi:hypothetical protein